MLRRFGLAVFVLLSLVAAAVPASAAKPKTYKVTTTADPSGGCTKPCSLRQTIAKASPGSIVSVPAGYYQLDPGLGALFIGKKLTIVGAGAANTVIAGNGNSQTTFADHIFSLDGGANVTFKGLTVTGGNATGGTQTGGGIDNAFGGTFRVISCVITGNHAVYGGAVSNGAGTGTITSSTLSDNTSQFSGGAINNNSSLTISKTTITHNAAQGGDGGGVHNFETAVPPGTAHAVIVGSTISDNAASNHGGGLNNDGSAGRTPSLAVTSSSILANQSTNQGGGIDINLGHVTLTGSTVSGNSGSIGGGISNRGIGDVVAVTQSTIASNTAPAGGGVDDAGTNGSVTITRSTVARNFGSGGTGTGGGLENDSSSDAFTIASSTVNANKAHNGGGLEALNGTTTINDSTFAENTATGFGGAFNTDGGAIVVTASTITGNSATSGGGFDEAAPTPLNLTSSILSDNSGGPGDCNGSITSGGYNVIGSGTGCTITTGPEDSIGASPNLKPLGFYGGPTETEAIASSASVAVRNAATDPACNGHTRDQRGVLRPAHKCDSGSFQFTQ